MTSINDIIGARNAAVNIIDQEIKDALAKQNAAASEAAADRFHDPIHQLMILRVAIFSQAANDAMGSDEMTTALDTLRRVTSDMTTVAARMGSVTGFFHNIADFLHAASQVPGAMKGP